MTTKAVQISADVAAGVTIAEANDLNGLLITVVTILGRLLVEFVIHKLKRRKE
jgi:hypothetical protein